MSGFYTNDLGSSTNQLSINLPIYLSIHGIRTIINFQNEIKRLENQKYKCDSNG